MIQFIKTPEKKGENFCNNPEINKANREFINKNLDYKDYDDDSLKKISIKFVEGLNKYCKNYSEDYDNILKEKASTLMNKLDSWEFYHIIKTCAEGIKENDAKNYTRPLMKFINNGILNDVITHEQFKNWCNKYSKEENFKFSASPKYQRNLSAKDVVFNKNASEREILNIINDINIPTPSPPATSEELKKEQIIGSFVSFLEDYYKRDPDNFKSKESLCTPFCEQGVTLDFVNFSNLMKLNINTGFDEKQLLIIFKEITGRNDDKGTFTCEKFLNFLNKYKNSNWSTGFIKALMPDLTAEQIKEIERKNEIEKQKKLKEKKEKEIEKNKEDVAKKFFIALEKFCENKNIKTKIDLLNNFFYLLQHDFKKSLQLNYTLDFIRNSSQNLGIKKDESKIVFEKITGSKDKTDTDVNEFFDFLEKYKNTEGSTGYLKTILEKNPEKLTVVNQTGTPLINPNENLKFKDEKELFYYVFNCFEKFAIHKQLKTTNDLFLPFIDSNNNQNNINYNHFKNVIKRICGNLSDFDVSKVFIEIVGNTSLVEQSNFDKSKYFEFLRKYQDCPNSNGFIKKILEDNSILITQTNQKSLTKQGKSISQIKNIAFISLEKYFSDNGFSTIDKMVNHFPFNENGMINPATFEKTISPITKKELNPQEIDKLFEVISGKKMTEKDLFLNKKQLISFLYDNRNTFGNAGFIKKAFDEEDKMKKDKDLIKMIFEIFEKKCQDEKYISTYQLFLNIAKEGLFGPIINLQNFGNWMKLVTQNNQILPQYIERIFILIVGRQAKDINFDSISYEELNEFLEKNKNLSNGYIGKMLKDIKKSIFKFSFLGLENASQALKLNATGDIYTGLFGLNNIREYVNFEQFRIKMKSVLKFEDDRLTELFNEIKANRSSDDFGPKEFLNFLLKYKDTEGSTGFIKNIIEAEEVKYNDQQDKNQLIQNILTGLNVATQNKRTITEDVIFGLFKNVDDYYSIPRDSFVDGLNSLVKISGATKKTKYTINQICEDISNKGLGFGNIVEISAAEFLDFLVANQNLANLSKAFSAFLNDYEAKKKSNKLHLRKNAFYAETSKKLVNRVNEYVSKYQRPDFDVYNVISIFDPDVNKYTINKDQFKSGLNKIGQFTDKELFFLWEGICEKYPNQLNDKEIKLSDYLLFLGSVSAMNTMKIIPRLTKVLNDYASKKFDLKTSKKKNIFSKTISGVTKMISNIGTKKTGSQGQKTKKFNTTMDLEEIKEKDENDSSEKKGGSEGNTIQMPVSEEVQKTDTKLKAKPKVDVYVKKKSPEKSQTTVKSSKHEVKSNIMPSSSKQTKQEDEEAQQSLLSKKRNTIKEVEAEEEPQQKTKKDSKKKTNDDAEKESKIKKTQKSSEKKKGFILKTTDIIQKIIPLKFKFKTKNRPVPFKSLFVNDFVSKLKEIGDQIKLDENLSFGKSKNTVINYNTIIQKLHEIYYNTDYINLNVEHAIMFFEELAKAIFPNLTNDEKNQIVDYCLYQLTTKVETEKGDFEAIGKFSNSKELVKNVNETLHEGYGNIDDRMIKLTQTNGIEIEYLGASKNIMHIYLDGIEIKDSDILNKFPRRTSIYRRLEPEDLKTKYFLLDSKDKVSENIIKGIFTTTFPTGTHTMMIGGYQITFYYNAVNCKIVSISKKKPTDWTSETIKEDDFKPLTIFDVILYKEDESTIQILSYFESSVAGRQPPELASTLFFARLHNLSGFGIFKCHDKIKIYFDQMDHKICHISVNGEALKSKFKKEFLSAYPDSTKIFRKITLLDFTNAAYQRYKPKDYVNLEKKYSFHNEMNGVYFAYDQKGKVRVIGYSEKYKDKKEYFNFKKEDLKDLTIKDIYTYKKEKLYLNSVAAYELYDDEDAIEAVPITKKDVIKMIKTREAINLMGEDRARSISFQKTQNAFFSQTLRDLKK